MMHMTFYWSKEVTLLVESWQTTTWTSYAFTLLACFLASAFYQFMEHSRVRLKLSSSASASAADPAEAAKPSPAAAAASAEDPLATPFLGSKVSSSAGGGKRWTVARVGGAVLFGLNAAVGYLLMLAVMSFNGGVFVSVVCGLGVGYLVFRSGTDEAVTVTAPADNACACA